MSATIPTPTSDALPTASERSERSERSLRALVLDADPFARAAAVGALGERGFGVLAADDGTAGLALLLDQLLDLDALVLDLELPGRDAWSFLRLVRDAGGERDLAVVVVASGVTPGLRAQLRALGADAVLDRAAGPAALAAAVELAVRHPGFGILRRRAAAVADSLAALLAPAPAPAWAGR